MRRRLPTLRLGNPCAMRWEELDGEGAVRHCAECGLDVTDLSAMTEREAERFLAAREASGARVCISFVVDEHGAVQTRDRRRPGVAAAVALSAAMAACAPDPAAHEEAVNVRAADHVTAAIGEATTKYEPPPPPPAKPVACRVPPKGKHDPRLVGF